MWLLSLHKEKEAGEGLQLPRLYSMGFAHNNCGGFRIKAGRASFANLLRRMPERYARHEQQEWETREWQEANGVQKGHVLYKDRDGKRERNRQDQESRCRPGRNRDRQDRDQRDRRGTAGENH